MRRITCVVEGKGEVAAVPRLVARILYQLLERSPVAWQVDADPIRQPRGRLVAEGEPRGKRGPHPVGVPRAIALVRARSAHAALILVDRHQDCTGPWGPPTRALVSAQLPGAAVMVVREYEAWLLAGHSAWSGPGNAAEVKNAKAALKHLWPRYKPTTHQLDLTNTMDLRLASDRSASFRYLVAQLHRLTG
jgi:hypothetical protein